MRQIKRLKAFVCALAGTALLSACSSEADEIINEAGKGYVSLSVQADAGFQTTRAASEEAYEDVNNYTVQIWKGEDLFNEYKPIPSTLKLDAGTYTVKAFYGENLTASTEYMYVAGESEVTLAAGETKTAKVVCTPACAKVTIDFEKAMATYFSDYSVSFKTKALDESTYIWEKANTDPVYLKVDNNESVTMAIKLPPKEGQPFSKSYSQTLSPKQAFTLHVKPQVKEPGETGLGITITIDEGTNDPIEIEIDIPSNWIDDTTTNE